MCPESAWGQPDKRDYHNRRQLDLVDLDYPVRDYPVRDYPRDSSVKVRTKQTTVLCFTKIQGWEFALWFSMQITRFLTKSAKCSFALFKRANRSLKNSFQRATRVNRSRHSFLFFIKAKIKKCDLQ